MLTITLGIGTKMALWAVGYGPAPEMRSILGAEWASREGA